MASHALPTPPCTTCSPPRPPPSRLVAAYHTSVKRHSVLAMKSLYVRTYIHARVECVRARAGARAHERACVGRARVRARIHARTGMQTCASTRENPYILGVRIRIIYSAGASLTAPTVTGRSSGRFSARMTVYGSLFFANFFRFPVSLNFCPSRLYRHMRVGYATARRIASPAQKYFH